MPQLALDIGFCRELDSLQKPVKKGVFRTWEKFRALTLPQLYADRGLRLESLETALDPKIRTVRIGDHWRGVVLAPEAGETFVLLKVLPHDEAIAWGAKQKASINPATRNVEIRDIGRLEELTPAVEGLAAGAPATALFAEFSDKELRSLGIDDDTLRRARTLTSMEQLDAFAPVLPPDQSEVLMYLATGWTVKEVWKDIVAHRAVAEDVPLEPGDFESAIRRTSSRIALVTAPEELSAILDQPFSAWRVFLHPTQHRIAYRSGYSGPAQISGGPGTGKTVVALHRVKYLLGQLAKDERILLTTYTKPLENALRSGLRQLVEDRAAVDRVDICTVDSFAHRVITRSGTRPLKPVSGEVEESYWQRVVDELQLSWTPQFLAQEYRHVILAQDIENETAYRNASRRGRGSALHPNRKPEVWRAVQRFTELLADKGLCTYPQRAALAARLLRESGPPYRHVVVDEAQDLHPAQWRTLRAAVAEQPDDLFIAGDPHQRIYDSKVSLKAVGISVAGRSARLRKNYRSTQEILGWATALLIGRPVGELAGSGHEDTLADCRSALRGTVPVTAAARDAEQELDQLVKQLRGWLSAGVAAEEIGVTTRFNRAVETVLARLRREDIPARSLRSEGTGAKGAVAVGTMHAFKGLEFRCVAVHGARQGAVPFPKAVTPPEVDRVQHDTDLMAERCLLFVAATRAREQLYVSWTGTPSEFLREAGLA
ncbi:UvrD-helicase domain-containing protein [Streptomyces carpaticus]|uniref:DNA 3'-5' helicase n=1 Tax=Streptomyces carpaticus TaxID=285558 RepID=A0ABV4ZN19_9ACTN